MNPRTRTSILAIAATLTLAGAAWWSWGHYHRPKLPDRKPSPPALAAKPMPKPATANPAVAANPPAPSPAVAPNPAAPPSPPAGARLELAGTLRMYLAHAPLRTAEVANPDSPGNRQILEAMVRKALQNPAPVALKARPKP